MVDTVGSFRWAWSDSKLVLLGATTNRSSIRCPVRRIHSIIVSLLWSSQVRYRRDPFIFCFFLPPPVPPPPPFPPPPHTSPRRLLSVVFLGEIIPARWAFA